MFVIEKDETKMPAQMRAAPGEEESAAAQEAIAAEGARLCARATGCKARAVVLTGSLSRGEATLKRAGLGWRALGDATFLIVLHRAARIDTASIEAEIEQALVSQGIICKIVVVVSTASALRKMKAHIYAFELKERGRVLWGDPCVLDLMPRFTPADIPMEDGWWFLSNRMIEQLESAAQDKGRPDHDARVNYRIAKLYLSMAACYLLVIGEYEPSYRDRARRLRELADASVPPPSPVPLRRFSKLVSRCTDLKLQGHASGEPGEFPDWRDAQADAEALWRWTLVRLSDADPNSSRSELLAIMRRRQPWYRWAKGWVRAAIVHRAVFGRHWHRWMRLARSGSPRYLVYGAASELFFHAGEAGSAAPRELAEIARTLPLSPGNDRQQLTWDDAAALVARNFHSFVESTRS